MTTYAQREQSAADSEPIELYEFSRVIGTATQKWLYTSSDKPVTFGGEIFDATPGLKRGPILQNNEDVTMTVEVEIPRLACITEELHGTVSPSPMNLRILRWQRNLAEVEVASLFNGEISGSYFEGVMVHLTGSSEESAWGDQLGRVSCQRLCPHMLYDEFCGADPAIATFTYRIMDIAVDRMSMTVALEDENGIAAWTEPGAHAFVNGVLNHMGYHRYITGQDEDVLSLQLPLMDNVVVNDLCTLAAGCDRSRTDCKDLHNNVERYGGFPLMPDRNPWGSIR